MLINAAEPEECRIAVLDGDVLEELIVNRRTEESYLGNIYKGRVVSVERSIQAAFVDFGVEQNGFLHVSDIMPAYGKGGVKKGSGKKDARKKDARKKDARKRDSKKGDIASLLSKGQEVLVQITKDPIGTKAPTLTTYISLPGRYMVLMPGLSKKGISKKIEDEDERDRLRSILDQLSSPKGMGCIIRTAGAHRTKTDLVRDLNYLLNLWKAISKKVKVTDSPAPIYEESDTVIRTIRDLFNKEIKEILIDEKTAFESAERFMEEVMPRYKKRVKFYKESKPLFNRFHVEDQIEKINDRKVPLKHGGSIIIEQTEALVAIDVNSGKFKDKKSLEETAFRTNLDAVEETARQLRLRDMGGLIVCDFIDMKEEKHRQALERAMKSALKKDRARTRVARISKFCIIEMTRQRVGESLKQTIYSPCPVCGGTGLLKTVESMALHVIRKIQNRLAEKEVKAIELRVHPEVNSYLHNKKRDFLRSLEKKSKKPISVKADSDIGMEDCKFS
jgi:ribonuclease E